MSTIVGYSTCLLCEKKILRHARQVQCTHCKNIFHLKCLALSPDSMNAILEETSWICLVCLGCIFPFNQVDDDSEFIEVLDDFFPSNNNTLLFLSDNIFQPFLFDDSISPLDNIDPDVNFYNDLDLGECKYYLENTFEDEISTTGFSNVHVSLFMQTYVVQRKISTI